MIDCHHCGGRIRERSDDIVLTHRTDKTAEKYFYHDDGFGGECREAAYAAHDALGKNAWWLTHRPYMWTPEAAELLERR